MVLDPEAAHSFFTLWRCIDAFVCGRTGVLPGIDAPEQMHGASIAEVVQIRTVLWDEPTLLDAFASDNPYGLPAAQLEDALGFRWGVRNHFFVERCLKRHSVFICDGDDRVYAVQGLSEPVEEVIGRGGTGHLPAMVEVGLLPFRGAIVWDGFPRCYNIRFGPGIRRRLKETYLQAKARGGILTTLGP